MRIEEGFQQASPTVSFLQFPEVLFIDSLSSTKCVYLGHGSPSTIETLVAQKVIVIRNPDPSILNPRRQYI